ncbi:MAG: methylmalonyl-CoA epimerase [Bacteroidetes bacterium SW_9_63_38]|nr:MAG: methylmalonyl-CoA epimerase [Bacteroidetes bacterium SW_9_63_38]
MARLDHIGVAVDDVESVIDCFDDLLGIRPYKNEPVPRQKVRTHFLDTAVGKLEFLESLDEESPIQKYLEQWGEGVHHLAFKVQDLEATMTRLTDAGFTLVNETPQPGADDKRVAFVHPQDTHGMLVEFCETRTPPSWTPETVPHRDGELAYYSKGHPDNPCIVFLHGAGGTTLLDTAPLMRHLASRYHVVGVDLCGHGNTSIPDDETMSMDRFVEDIRATLNALDHSSCHLFGFSLGSSVALKTAADSPDLVDRLALFAPNGRWNNELVDTLNSHLDLDALKRHIPKQAERLFRHHQAPERLFPILQDFVGTLPAANEDMIATLNRVSHPTLVAGLDEDLLFSVDATQFVYENLEKARLSILPGQKHRLVPDTVELLVPLLHRHFGPEP